MEMKSSKYSLVPSLLAKKISFVVILLKIVKKQRYTFTSNEDFQLNLVNSQYILHMIVDVVSQHLLVYSVF